MPQIKIIFNIVEDLGNSIEKGFQYVTGDAVKNAGSEAIEDSFHKTFEELNTSR